MIEYIFFASILASCITLLISPPIEYYFKEEYGDVLSIISTFSLYVSIFIFACTLFHMLFLIVEA